MTRLSIPLAALLFFACSNSTVNGLDPTPTPTVDPDATATPTPSPTPTLPPGSYKNVFVTSNAGTADLSTWLVGSGTGLARADSICAAEASSAGLSGTFKAWLSTTTVNAKDRIGNDAGGWVRTDGFPFARSMTGLTTEDQLAFVPVLLTASGSAVPATTTVWTATSAAGVYDGNKDCSGWTSTLDSTSIGSAQAGRIDWTDMDGVLLNKDCSASRRLYCFETGPGPEVPSEISDGKLVFLTSTVSNGAMGGLHGADAKCNELALTGNFVAWLSDSTHNAIDRITGDGPWVLNNGVRVAGTRLDLIDGSVFTSINQDETGAYQSGGYVWTATNSNGAKMTDHCNNWTSPTGDYNARVGHSSATIGGNWTLISNDLLIACQSALRLYCFEN